MPSSHNLKTEHRLTVVEMKVESHGDRLDDLESSKITPRDWYMVAVGLAVIGAAIGKKIDWATALALLAKN
jgi:hypothetical protein